MKGTELTGASLTAVTVMVKVCGGEVSCPPLAVPLESLATAVSVDVPEALNAGEYCKAPLELMKGVPLKRDGLLLSVITKKTD